MLSRTETLKYDTDFGTSVIPSAKCRFPLAILFFLPNNCGPLTFCLVNLQPRPQGSPQGSQGTRFVALQFGLPWQIRLLTL